MSNRLDSFVFVQAADAAWKTRPAPMGESAPLVDAAAALDAAGQT